MSNPKFEIDKAINGEFYFNLKAGNGEKILTSERYKTNQGCRGGIASAKVNAPYDVRYERKGTEGNYRFNLKAASGEVIGSSEGYKTADGRDRGIESVKRNAPIADIVDLT